MSWNPTQIYQIKSVNLKTSTTPCSVMTDAGEAYLKTLNNPQGPTALLCEYLGTRLAAWLGLPTFDISIINTPNGPAFISRAEDGDLWDGTHEKLNSIENPEAINGLVVFDTWTRNMDRYFYREPRPICNYGNVFLSRERAQLNGYRLIAMDHTECFRCLKGELMPKLLHMNAIQEDRLYGLFPAFIPFISKARFYPFVERLALFSNESVLEPILYEIPYEWGLTEDLKTALVKFCNQRAYYLKTHIMDWVDEARLEFNQKRINQKREV